MLSGGHLSQHFLIYTTSYRQSVSGRYVSITVAFFSSTEAGGEELSRALADFFLTIPHTEELLILAPHDLCDQASKLAGSDELVRATKFSPFTSVEYATVEAGGDWNRGSDDSSLSDPEFRRVVQSGLRWIFANGEGLLTTEGGYHFIKPSKKHSATFIRAGSTLTRSCVVYFVAASCLEFAARFDVKYIVIDSGSISSVGYALRDLRRRLSPSIDEVLVDSFSGYQGLKTFQVSDPARTLVLVSASTSGSLLRDIEKHLAVPIDQQLILFYVGNSYIPKSVLCDLTRRAADTRQEWLVDPWDSWDLTECKLCKNGQPAIELRGDAFLPSAGTLTSRMLTKKHAPDDLSAFVKSFRGVSAFRVRASDRSASPRLRSTLISLSTALSGGGAVGRQLLQDLERQLLRSIPMGTRQIVTLEDEDALFVSSVAQRMIEDRTGSPVKLIRAGELTQSEQVELDEGYVFVIAGVVAGGRQLLAVSRALRKAHVGQEISYFVAMARPVTVARWDRLAIDLGFGPTGPRHYPVNVLWRMPSDPDRGDRDAWVREGYLLGRISQFILEHLGGHPRQREFYELIERRQEDLSAIGVDDSDSLLFAPSTYGAKAKSVDVRLRLNPNFAFWDFDYSDLERHAEEEVYFTVLTVMHNARFTKDGKFALVDEGGSRYVLSPENFSRFNDAIIQASLVRAATNLELDYRADSALSSSMNDIIVHSLRTSHAQDGQAAAEFLISLCGGLLDSSGGYIRLKDVHVENLAELVRNDQLPAEYPPLVHLLLLFLDHLWSLRGDSMHASERSERGGV